MTGRHVFAPRSEAMRPGSAAQAMACSQRLLEDTMQHPDRRLLQAMAIADGIVVGGMKAGADKALHKPQDLCMDVVKGAAIGAALGVAATAEAPVIAAGAAVIGVGLTGAYLYGLGHRLANDKPLYKALDKAGRSKDSAEFGKALSVVERSLGSESFDFALGAIVGAKVGRAVPNFYARLPKPNQLECDMLPRPLESTLPKGEPRSLTQLRSRPHDPCDFSYLRELPVHLRAAKAMELIKNNNFSEARAYLSANANLHSHYGHAVEKDPHGFSTEQNRDIAAAFRTAQFNLLRATRNDSTASLSGPSKQLILAPLKKLGYPATL